MIASGTILVIRIVTVLLLALAWRVVAIYRHTELVLIHGGTALAPTERGDGTMTGRVLTALLNAMS